jgi:hypothetical protein
MAACTVVIIPSAYSRGLKPFFDSTASASGYF